MFVVANWGRLEMCGVGWMDAYVIGLSRRMGEMCVHVRTREWDYVRTGERWEMEGVGHINKDLANIMIMFEHSPELVLAGSSSPK